MFVRSGLSFVMRHSMRKKQQTNATNEQQTEEDGIIHTEKKKQNKIARAYTAE